MNGSGEKAAMAASTGGGGETPAPAAVIHNDVKLAGEESKERMYESKHHKKVVRVLTVLAYVLSVSLAAIMLSLYYVFLWDPRSTRNATRFTAAQLPSSRPLPTRCPPDLGAWPPGIVDKRGQDHYPVTTPSVSAEGRDNDLLDDEDDEGGAVEPPRALPRAPPHEGKSPPISSQQQELQPPVASAPTPPPAA